MRRYGIEAGLALYAVFTLVAFSWFQLNSPMLEAVQNPAHESLLENDTEHYIPVVDALWRFAVAPLLFVPLGLLAQWPRRLKELVGHQGRWRLDVGRLLIWGLPGALLSLSTWLYYSALFPWGLDEVIHVFLPHRVIAYSEIPSMLVGGTLVGVGIARAIVRE